MTTAKAIKYMGAMVDVSTDEIGQDNAIRQIAREVGLSPWSAYRIVKGKVKSVSSDTFDRINRRYLAFCAAEIRKFQNELQEARDAHPDLDREAEALVAKLMEAKAAMRKARKSSTGERA